MVKIWKMTALCRKNIPMLDECQLLVNNIRNVSKNNIHIDEWFVHPDWLKGRKSYHKKCSLELKPKEKGTLPTINFKIPSNVKLGAHPLKIGIGLSIYRNGKWKDISSWSDTPLRIFIDKAQHKKFKIFISHRTKGDERILNRLLDALDNCGYEYYVAETNHSNENLWNKIDKNVQDSDCFLLLWTKHSSKSPDVIEEIGFARGRNKEIIILSEIDLRTSLKGKEYVKINRDKLDESIEHIISVINNIHEQIKLKSATS